MSTDQIPTITPRALTIRTFCDTYGIGRTLCSELMAAGAFEVRRVGKRVLIDAISAAAWYEGLPRGPGKRRRAA